MKSTIDWHLQQHHMLKNALNSMSGGKRACLVKEGLHVETNLTHLERCFRPYIAEVLLPTFFFDLIETVHLDNESLLRDKTCTEDNWDYCEDEYYSEDDDGDDDDDDDDDGNDDDGDVE